MGQYYIVANIDKKEYMRSNGGVKLMEWSYNRNPLVLNLMKKLANEWKNDRVFVAGDYALIKDRIDKDKNPIEKDYDYEILEKIEKELNIYDKEDKGYDITLYGFANDNFKEIKLEKLENEEYRYIYNHNKKEFIDLEHCPLAWLYKEKGNYKQVKISPISLLLALGNGMGGGDYWGNNHTMVGKYIEDVDKLEITKEPLKVDYLEFRPEFYENDYVPYNEIPNEINLQKRKEKLAKDIVEFLSNYDKKNFKEYYIDKKNAISRTEFSLDYESNGKIEELSNVIENNHEPEVIDKYNNLIERIIDYKLEKAVRSNKSKSDIEFANETDEDKYINETYKRIFEQLKLKNIENITTDNKETVIVFETQENYKIDTKNQDEIKDYIDNTKKVQKISQEQRETIKYTEIQERIPKKLRRSDLFYYEYRESGEEKVIEKGVWVDFAGTLITNKDILKDKEYMDREQLFNNNKILMLDDSNIDEKIKKDLETKMEDEENEYEE